MRHGAGRGMYITRCRRLSVCCNICWQILLFVVLCVVCGVYVGVAAPGVQGARRFCSAVSLALQYWCRTVCLHLSERERRLGCAKKG